MKLTKHLFMGMLGIVLASTPRVMAQGYMHNMDHGQMEAAKAVDTTAATNTVDSTSTAKVEYRCPMDKDVVSSKPGKCPKCGMALKKVALQEASAEHMEHSAKAITEPAKSGPKGADSVKVQHNHDKM